MSELLSMQGRFNRSKYVITTLVITAVTFGAAVAVTVVGMGEDMVGVIGGAVGLCGQIVIAFVVVKRLHDLNRPGWHFWLLIVPLYNLYLSFVMLLTKGTEGSNQYGADPSVA